MILLDTNVLIYAHNPDSPFYQWASNTISEAVAGDGAAVNAVSIAELCVREIEPNTFADRVRSWGVDVLDVPAAAAETCAAAYRKYCERREQESGKTASRVPLPDFFIGAHAFIMGWELATAYRGRFNTYFPEVTLILPE